MLIAQELKEGLMDPSSLVVFSLALLKFAILSIVFFGMAAFEKHDVMHLQHA